MSEPTGADLEEWFREFEDEEISRRTLVKRLVAAGFSMSVVAAALGTVESPARAAVASGAAVPKRGGILNFGWTEEIASLDPHASPSYSSINFFYFVYSTLLKLDKNLRPVGDLAQSWTVSNDGLTYVFKLRPGLRFSNGDTLTSADVKASLERIIDPKTSAIGAAFLAGVDSVTAPNPTTVVAHLSQASAALPVYLTNPATNIISAKLIASGADFNKIQNAIGSGPWKVDKWVPNSFMQLSRNPHFYERNKPYINQIKTTIVPNPDSLVAAMRTGAVDFTWSLDARIGKEARSASRLHILKTPDLSYFLLFMNVSRKPFNHPDVRRALSYAIDRKAIIRAANLGEGVPIAPIPAGVRRYALSLDKEPLYKRDVAKARRLLAKAGYPRGFSFEMLAPTSEPDNAPAIAQAVQSQLKDVGIHASIKTMEFTAWVSRWLKADFFMTPGNNSGAPDPDYYLFRYWYSKGNLNFVSGHFHTPQLDRALLTGHSASSFNRRRRAYNAAQEILITQAPWLWLYSGYMYTLLNKRVRGFVPRADHSLVGLRDAWLSS